MYIIGLFIILTMISCTPQDETSKLIVGMELAYPPFETKDIDGKPMGVSVDLAEALGEYLGVEVVIENIAWTGLIPSLQTGKIDVIISSMTITDERKKKVDFSDPYAQVRLSMLVNKDSQITSIEDINKKGQIIAVKQGTTPFFYAHNNLTNTTINSFTSESAAMTEMLQGKADAVLYDQLTIYYNFKRNEDKTRIVFINQKQKDIEHLGFAVKKGNTELLTEINAFLSEYKSENKIKQTIQKYLSTEQEFFDEHNVSFFF